MHLCTQHQRWVLSVLSACTITSVCRSPRLTVTAWTSHYQTARIMNNYTPIPIAISAAVTGNAAATWMEELTPSRRGEWQTATQLRRDAPSFIWSARKEECSDIKNVNSWGYYRLCKNEEFHLPVLEFVLEIKPGRTLVLLLVSENYCVIFFFEIGSCWPRWQGSTRMCVGNAKITNKIGNKWKEAAKRWFHCCINILFDLKCVW